MYILTIRHIRLAAAISPSTKPRRLCAVSMEQIKTLGYRNRLPAQL